MAGRTLAELDLCSEVGLVLGIERPDATYVGVPREPRHGRRAAPFSTRLTRCPKTTIVNVSPAASVAARTCPSMALALERREDPMQVFDHFENWDNFANKCSVCLHAVDGNGTILWANDTELKSMGYAPEEYIGRFIGDFHVDRDVVEDILGRLTRDETVNAYPARLRAKDGSIKYVMINSNVYRQKTGEFEHTRCFTTVIDEKAFKALKQH